MPQTRHGLITDTLRTNYGQPHHGRATDISRTLYGLNTDAARAHDGQDTDERRAGREGRRVRGGVQSFVGSCLCRWSFALWTHGGRTTGGGIVRDEDTRWSCRWTVGGLYMDVSRARHGLTTGTPRTNHGHLTDRRRQTSNGLSTGGRPFVPRTKTRYGHTTDRPRACYGLQMD